MKRFEKLAYVVCFLAAMYFAGHILYYLRTIPVETTAFWIVIRFVIGWMVGLIGGFLVVGLCASGKMEDARRAIYAAVSGDLSLCKQFYNEGR